MQKSILTSDLASLVSGVTQKPDGTGLLVYPSKTFLTSGENTEDLHVQISQLIDNSVNVEISTDKPLTLHETVLTRQSDASPWSGGAGYKMRNANFAIDHCSTAAGVYSNSNNVAYLLTAGHCLKNLASSTQVRTGDSSLLVGYTDPYAYGFLDQSHDAALIKVDSNQVSSSVYHGGYIAQSKYAIAGDYSPAIGDSVCTSGANSGSHCGLVVKDLALLVKIENVLVTVVRAESPTHAEAVAAGDSGGPVLFQTQSGSTLFTGTISGYLTPLANCQPTYYSTTECGEDVLFPLAASELSALHMHL